MIACLNVPYFAATVERRGGDYGASAGNQAVVESRQAPGLVLGGQPWEPQPVYAFSHEAAQQGVKSGMSLRLAHVLSPEAQFMAADPPRYYDASAEVAGVLLDFTHLIEIDALWAPPKNKAAGRTLTGPGAALGWRLPAAYTLDLESLPPAEALDLAQEMGRQVRRQTQLAPAISLAKSKFVAQVAASLTRPIKELRGFARVTLEPGQSRSVTFTLAAEQLAFVDQPGRWLVEPGEFRLMVGSSSVDLPLEASLTVGGTARHIESRSRYLTQVSVR